MNKVLLAVVTWIGLSCSTKWVYHKEKSMEQIRRSNLSLFYNSEMERIYWVNSFVHRYFEVSLQAEIRYFCTFFQTIFKIKCSKFGESYESNSSCPYLWHQTPSFTMNAMLILLRKWKINLTWYTYLYVH